MVSDYGSIDGLIMKLTRYSHSGIVSVGQCGEKTAFTRMFAFTANMKTCLLSQGASYRCGQKTTLIADEWTAHGRSCDPCPGSTCRV